LFFLIRLSLWLLLAGTTCVALVAASEDEVIFVIEVGAGGGECVTASQQMCLLLEQDYPHGGG